ncbi:MAG TPA: LuxR C-terminal-related transcriptional regulator [Acidimicrobiales bacterium]|nr:LuxR C-terminal-related transcriptional regulator [Acidimicrobiales bacterium]
MPAPAAPILPLHLTSFVGRERELAGVDALVASHRLVTLTGSGGCGKTRLALQIAARHRNVCFVDLAPVESEAEVASTVAASLGAKTPRGQAPMATVTASIGDAPLVLVLDNCEHLVEGVAQLTGVLLGACSGVTVLATSRERLVVPGEVTVRVPSLSMPEAVTLFIDRSRDASADFEAAGAELEAIAEICTQLDGIPLAIELAAARTSTLTVRQIASGLGDSLRLLTRGPRTTLPRHKTLRASVEWSSELLVEDERIAFRRLAVFAGGFMLDAAEAVLGVDPLPVANVLDLVTSLVEKSLVTVDRSGPEARYRLLETIRQYADEQLKGAGGDEVASTTTRHRAHQRELLRRAAEEAQSPEQAVWQGRVELELDNIRAALHAAQRDGDGEGLIDLVCAMGTTWTLQGQYAEQRSWLEAALALAPEESKRRAEALYQLGNALFASDVPRAVELMGSAIDLHRLQGDENGEFWTMIELAGGVAMLHGFDAAVSRYDEAESLAERLADLGAIRYAQFHRANALIWSGRLAEGRRQCEALLGRAPSPIEHHVRWLTSLFGAALANQGHMDEAVRVLEDLVSRTPRQDAATRSIAPAALGHALGFAGRLEEASAVLDGLPAFAHELGFRGLALQAVGMIELLRGDADAARVALEEATEQFSAMWWRYVPAITPALSDASIALGDHERARTLLDDAIELGTRFDAPAFVAIALERRAELAWVEGHVDRGLELVRSALSMLVAEDVVGGVVDGLELCAVMAVAGGRASDAGVFWHAAQRTRRRSGYRARMPHRSAWIEPAVSALPVGPTDAPVAVDDAIALLQRGRGPRPRSKTGWNALSVAERRVVSLVAQGLTNVQIGERLFISRHTVDSHLRHVFAKVGVSSRAELAAQAAQANGADA